MPSFVGASAIAAAAGTSVDVTLPVISQAQVDAHAVIVLRVMSKEITLPTNALNTPTGYTEKGTRVAMDFPGGAGNDCHTALFYKRAVIGDSGASVTVSRAGAGTRLLMAYAEVWGDCIQAGDPFDTAGIVTLEDVVDDGDVAPLPAFDPVAGSSHVVFCIVGTNDLSAATPASFTNGGTTFTQRVERSTTAGDDGCFVMYSADRDGDALAAVNLDLVQTSTRCHVAYAFALLPPTPEDAEAIEPIATTDAGDYTIIGGAVSHHVALTDENASTGIQSPANPVNESIEFTLSDIGTTLGGELVFEIDVIQV